MEFVFKHFEALSNIELYRILKLRTDVFVVEQNCPYPELDNKDLNAIHVFAQEGAEVIATARILSAGISYQEWSFGRIATHFEYRGKGVGKALMDSMMKYMQKNYTNEAVRISAQAHLEAFYSTYQFEFTGKSYLEDGIPHIEMLYNPI